MVTHHGGQRSAQFSAITDLANLGAVMARPVGVPVSTPSRKARKVIERALDRQ